jgi:hypothetical protein
MAYYDFDPSLDFDAQEQEMVQAAARIKALRAMKGIEPEQAEGFKSAVTGATILAPRVKKPLLSSLTPLIADYTGDQMEKELNKQRSSVNTADANNFASLMRSYPASHVEPMAPDAPRLSEGVDPVSMQKSIDLMTDPAQRADAQQALDNHKAGYQQLVQPGRQDYLDWVAKTQKGGPLTKSLGAKKAEDILLNEDERNAKMSMERTKFNENVRQFGVEEARKRLADENQARYWTGSLNKDAKAAKGSFDFMGNEPDPSDPSGKKQRSVHYNATTQETTYGPPKTEKEDAAVVKDRLEANNQYFRSRNILDESKNIKELIEKSTGSKVGNWIDTKWSALGGTTQGAAAIAALQPLGGMLLMSVPRFEGPQSDKDTATYKQASADIANPDTPNEQRWAAYQTMARLQLQHAAQVEDRYGMPKGAQGSVREVYKDMFGAPAGAKKESPLSKSNPRKPTGTTGDWNTPAAGGYKAPPAGSVDTTDLEAQYAAAKDPADKQVIAQKIMSVKPDWKPAGEWGIRRIK